MSLDLVSDVFEPVFLRLESERDYLTEWAPQRHKSARGLEERWFQPAIVAPALRARGYEVREYVCGAAPGQRGKVDLLLRAENSELELELKAANDLRVRYVAGIEKDGWMTKYVEQEQRSRLAGCLFLGCVSETKVQGRLRNLAETLKDPQKMRGHDIRLAQSRTFKPSDGCHWVLGLLVTPYGRTLLGRKDG